MSSIGYTWRIAGREQASGTKPHGCDSEGVARDVQAVSDALTRSIRLTYQGEDPETLARVLTTYWGPLRHQLLTDGVTATQESGGTWTSTAGPITVKLWCL
jgi:hypothetical protein